MNYIDLIKNYIPKEEQEAVDKETILKYIEQLGDSILLRENYVAHFVSSAWVMNATRDKVLMVSHNIYQSWMWTGGHVEGRQNFLNEAIRETKEETGLTSVVPISEDLYMLDIFPVPAHEKDGAPVPAHIHIGVTYLLEADENEPTRPQLSENKMVAWQLIKDVPNIATKPGMIRMGKKLIARLEKEPILPREQK